MKLYLIRIFVSIDQFFNVLLSPIVNRLLKTENFGHPDETISSALGKTQREQRCRVCDVLCKSLNFIENRLINRGRTNIDHCQKYIEDDEHANL